ncbi:collagen-like protein [Maribacter sp. R77961]|uniref:collagen-like protein n=1 Tax=Maribacter sp. R77961 TaxID=3093871 RepID=UPI0037C7EE2C
MIQKIFIVLVVVLSFTSCEGPAGFDGQPGPQGPAGADGSIFEAAAFEIELDFILNTDANIYEFGPEEYPTDITLIKDDVVLIYRLEEVNEGLDVWRQLPQPFFAEDGLMFYNFDFTEADFGLFVEPEFDVNLIAPDLVQDQVFRVVVIPGDLGTSSKMDQSSIYSVLNALGIEEKDIKKVN